MFAILVTKIHQQMRNQTTFVVNTEKSANIGILIVSISVCMILSGGITVACLKDVQKAYMVPGYTLMAWSFGLSITSSILYLVSGVGVIFA